MLSSRQPGVNDLSSIWNVWLFAAGTMIIFHLGVTRFPGWFLFSAVSLTLCGYALAPSTTCVTWWLLLFTSVIPQIALLHVGYYGVRGVLVVVIYWLWTWTQRRFDPDLRTAEKSRARQSQFWQFLAAYFPARLHMDAELKDGLYLFAVHPHGLWSSAVWCNLIPDSVGSGLPRRRVCTLDMNFKVPLLRDVLFAMGLIGSSSKSIRKSLNAGVSVMLVVGGGREAMLTRPGTMELVLQSRKGFVKIALETGAHLVPVLGFGETSCYTRAAGSSFWDPLNRFLLRTLGMSLPMLQGYCGTFLPHPTPLVTVVGQPLMVSKTPNPKQELIDKTHMEYCEALKALYDKYHLQLGQSHSSEIAFL